MSTWVEDSYEVARVVAHKVHRKYHTYFDVADVTNELMVWVLRHEAKIMGWLNHDVESDEYKVGTKMLGKTLTRHADKYCRRMKAQKAGYELRDEQFYSDITIAELLPFVWEQIVDTKKADDNERVSGVGNPAEGGNYVIQLFDIRRALLQMSEVDRDVLRKKFYENLSYQELARELSVSDTTAHRKVDGAVKRLGYALGGPNPWGGRDE